MNTSEVHFYPGTFLLIVELNFAFRKIKTEPAKKSVFSVRLMLSALRRHREPSKNRLTFVSEHQNQCHSRLQIHDTRDIRNFISTSHETKIPAIEKSHPPIARDKLPRVPSTAAPKNSYRTRRNIPTNGSRKKDRENDTSENAQRSFGKPRA